MLRLMNPSAIEGPCASDSASSCAAVSIYASGTTLVTMPIACASLAVSTGEVR